MTFIFYIYSTARKSLVLFSAEERPPRGLKADTLLQSSQWGESCACHLGSKVQLRSRRYKCPCSLGPTSEARAARASLYCRSLFPNVRAFHGSWSPTYCCFLQLSPQCFPAWWLLRGPSDGSVQFIPSCTEPGASCMGLQTVPPQQGWVQSFNVCKTDKATVSRWIASIVLRWTNFISYGSKILFCGDL